jgi:hypothetical protein
MKHTVRLFVPGLSWEAGLPAFALPPLPGLSALCARATHLNWETQVSTDPIAQTLSTLIGHAPAGAPRSALPWARWRAKGHGLSVSGHIVCADPAHLHFQRERVFISDVCAQPGLAPDHAEAQTLITAVRAVFPAPVRIMMASPSHWYLIDLPSPMPTFERLDKASGRPCQLAEPGGGADSWALWMNEAQTQLHRHPINAAREAKGLPTLNTLWFWGGSDEACPDYALPWKGHVEGVWLYADDPLIKGAWASEQGGRWASIPPTAAPILKGLANTPRLWVYLDALRTSAHHLDSIHWQNALALLDENWFVPLAQAVRSGQLKLEIWAPSGSGPSGFVLRCQAQDARCFWRRPKKSADVLFSC